MRKRISLWVFVPVLAFFCHGPVFADDIDFLLNAASHEASVGRLRAAEKHYRIVLRQDAQNIQAGFGLANVLNAQGKLTEAAELLEGLIRQHPDFQPAYYLLGTIYEGLGDLNRAKQAYRTYVAIAPTNVPPDPEIRIKLRNFGVF
jgi:predicted Zn-dependent protease